MKLHEILRAQVEELKRRDDELNREIQDCINRCDNLLNELQQLDE
jgi:prefoldin subunit 5